MIVTVQSDHEEDEEQSKPAATTRPVEPRGV